MSEAVIRWEEPPPHALAGRVTPSKYDEVAAELRQHPGQWGVVSTGRSTGTTGSLAYRIRAGNGPFGPRGAFEARVIGAAGGSTAELYARFVGEPPVATS